MTDISYLYQDIIMDHDKNPHNFFEMANYTHKANGYNPLCGDKYTIYLCVHEQVVKEISFQGIGCAISKSSASLMTDLLEGKRVEEVNRLVDQFHDMLLKDNALDEKTSQDLGVAVALSGVKQFPIRLKCATLAWHAVKASIDGQTEASTE